MKQAALRAVGALTNAQTLVLQRVSPPAADRNPQLADRARVLVVRLDETIGDSVMCSPFLRELRAFRPDAVIDLVVNVSRLDMYASCPYVDRVVSTSLGSAIDRRVLTRPLDARRLIAAEQLGPYDAAFVPRVDYDHHAAFVAAASEAPLRVGFTDDASSRKALVNRGVQRLYSHAVSAAPHRHEVDRQLDLLRLFGHEPNDTTPEVWLDEQSRADAERALEGAGLQHPYVVLAPSGGHSDLKQWPLERYVELARTLGAQHLTPVFIGGPSDRGLIEQLPDDVRRASVDLVGQLAPLVTAAVVERAAGFIGADSGMSHVAGALGVPTVAVFGPTCVHAFAPRGARSTVVLHELACNPCRRAADLDRCDRCIFASPICMSSVSADEAMRALTHAMA